MYEQMSFSLYLHLMTKDKVLTIRIDKKTKDKLKTLSKNSKRSMSDYIQLLIEFAIENNKKV